MFAININDDGLVLIQCSFYLLNAWKMELFLLSAADVESRSYFMTSCHPILIIAHKALKSGLNWSKLEPQGFQYEQDRTH